MPKITKEIQRYEWTSNSDEDETNIAVSPLNGSKSVDYNADTIEPSLKNIASCQQSGGDGGVNISEHLEWTVNDEFNLIISYIEEQGIKNVEEEIRKYTAPAVYVNRISEWLESPYITDFPSLHNENRIDKNSSTSWDP